MLALFLANLKIMTRDRQAIFWALLFPLILVLVFGIFDVTPTSKADLALIDHSRTDHSRQLGTKLLGIDYLNTTHNYLTEAEAMVNLREGDLEYILVIPSDLAEVSVLSKQLVKGTQDDRPLLFQLYYDANDAPNNQLVVETIRHFVDEENLRISGVPQPLDVRPVEVAFRDVDYFDVLLMGLVGMGMVTTSIIFIAVKISTYRNQSILKRILATPLRVRNYFISEILAHLLLTLVQASFLIGVGVLLFGATVHGNYFWLFFIVGFANTVFLNIGFIVSALVNSPRAASGMGNAIVIPMLFFSGTFFPTSTLPSFLPDLVQMLPMTSMLDAMRGVALHDLSLWGVWPDLAMLAIWLVVSTALAVRVFKFS